MKKSVIALSFVFLFSGISGAISVSAASRMSKKMCGSKMDCCKKSMMMKHRMMMRKGTLEVADDGTVIVLFGSRLFKYDKDLKLLSQATLPIGVDSSPETMMKSKCPMSEKKKSCCMSKKTTPTTQKKSRKKLW